MQPPVPKNELVIRTMKDDMNEMHSVPVVSGSAPVPASFPLSPKQEKKVEISPSKVAHTKHTALIGIVCIVVFAGLTAAGWYGYVWWASRQVIPEIPNQVRPVAEMIPKEATAIIAYSLD